MAIEDKRDIRKEVRFNGEETIALMRVSQELGIPESEVIRMGFRLFVKKFTEVGMLSGTGNLSD